MPCLDMITRTLLDRKGYGMLKIVEIRNVDMRQADRSIASLSEARIHIVRMEGPALVKLELSEKESPRQ